MQIEQGELVEPVARRGRSREHVFRDVILVLLLGGLLSLGGFYAIGPDPALEVLEEPVALREELRDFRLVPVGEFVGLNDGSPYRWVLGPGFAPPEADGTWVRAHRAQLIFYLPDTQRDNETADQLGYSLELSISPLLGDGQETRAVTLRSHSDEVRVDLPPEGGRVFVELGDTEEQIVELVCDSLDIPTEDQLTSDIRRLCVKVYAMAIRVEQVVG